MNLRALIVDDEQPARQGIRALLTTEPSVEVIGEAANGREAVALITSLDPDLVFLDVQMPELDGFEVVESIGPEHMPAVVFVTAYDHFALRAFEVHALDYLLKPFDRARFRKALGRTRAQLEQRNDRKLDRRIQCLLDELQKPKYQDRVAIRSGSRISFLRSEEIDWIESEANYVRLHAGKRSHLVRGSVREMAGKLDPERFTQIHRSTIVNLDRIQNLEAVSPTEYVVVLRDGTRLSASRGFRDPLRSALGIG